MEPFLELITSLHTPQGIENLIRSAGLIALVLIVFAETGLLVGFFLPGDSLMVTAGVLSASSFGGEEPVLHFATLNVALILAAIIGDQVGYLLGAKTGPKIFSRPDSRLFKREYVIAAHAFYEKHGGKAIVFARFVPVLRTFVPFIAGVASMPYKRFVFFNVFGGIFWVLGLTSIGHFIGRTPLGEKLHHVILVVVILSILPIIIGFLKQKPAKKT